MSTPLSLLPGFEPTTIELVRSLSVPELVERAVALLRQHEPQLVVGWGQQLYYRADGYYLAFSGGKDSCVILKLAELAGVRFEARYNQTTIDPPELIRFLKTTWPNVPWSISEYGNMMSRIAYNGMPTRFQRWCCREFKEWGGEGRVKVMGVRAEESKKRAKNWREVAQDWNKDKVLCPILYWTEEQVWEFIRFYNVPYCELYDQGQTRIGCVGCPLKNRREREADFVRWPRFKRNWQEACRKYWEANHTRVLANGKLNFASRFKTWEAMWEWWMSEKKPDVLREECQSGLLWTNQELDELND